MHPSGPGVIVCAAMLLVSSPVLADFESGQVAFAAGRLEEAFKEWESDAERGNPVAQFLIGNMYASGEGVDADLEVANSFYEKAALQGHVESALQLGTNLRLGQGAEIDYHGASKWLYMAAEAGHPVARFDLGEMFLYGDKANQFYPAPFHASQWFRLAGLDGIVLAQFKLSQLYFTGKGVAKDDVKGLVWLGMANKIASGAEAENKWSRKAMPLSRIVPNEDEDDKEERSFGQLIQETWLLKKVELPIKVVDEAESILASGATEKIR